MAAGRRTAGSSSEGHGPRRISKGVTRTIEESNPEWNSINFESAEIYDWNSKSTYILEPPFFVDMPAKAPGITSIKDARVLVWAGDSVTTDHISPAGAIDPNSPAGKYLREQGVDKQHFNSYGSRRGNDQIMGARHICKYPLSVIG